MWVFPEISDEAVAVSAESLEVGWVIIGAVIVNVVHIQLAWVKCNKSAAFAAIPHMLAIVLAYSHPAYTTFFHRQLPVWGLQRPQQEPPSPPACITDASKLRDASLIASSMLPLINITVPTYRSLNRHTYSIQYKDPCWQARWCGSHPPVAPVKQKGPASYVNLDGCICQLMEV